MPKPRGGRGNTAPYNTKLARLPIPLTDQVSQLIDRYQSFIAEGGDPLAPPLLLDSNPERKQNNEFSDGGGYAFRCITVPPQLDDDSKSTDKEMFPASIIEGGVIRWNVYESTEGYDREQKKNAWGEWKLVASCKTEYEADKTISSRKEHNHRLNSDRGDYGIVSLRFEKRNEVIAPATADITVTPTAKELLLEVEQLRSQLMEVNACNEALEAEVKKWVQSSAQAQYQLDDVVAERDQLRSQQECMAALAAESDPMLQDKHQLPDMEHLRDRVLGSLRLGRQAPEYKRTKATLDRFIAELRRG